MHVPVFFALLFLTVIAGTVSVNQEECVDGKRDIEVVTQEKASFEFKSPANLNGDLNTELISWTIFGPDGWTMCKTDHPTPHFNLKKLGSIDGCYIRHTSSECYTSGVLLPPFLLDLAGIWKISREYLVRTIDKRSYKTENYSVNIYETEFDHRFNNTIQRVGEGSYIVVNLEEKNYENSECRLIHRKTNKTYDLNAKEYRFSGKRTGIQKLDGCGFRMQIENKSEALWSLVGEFGWTRQRADFQLLSVKSPVSQEAEKISRWWVEDFPIKFTIMDLSHAWTVSPRLKYWELERPDGKIFLQSDASQEYINFDQITKDDEGLWKMRESFNEYSMFLIETNLSVTVIDLPEIYYSWPRNSNKWSIFVPSPKEYMPTACVLKNRNGKNLFGTYFQDQESIEFNKGSFSFDVAGILDEKSTDEWEFSLNYDHITVNGLIVGKKLPENEISSLPHVWKSVRRMKYVVRGEEIKVKCSANAPLTNCTLTNPDNVTKYFLDDNSLITRIKCSEGIGFCGCILTIENAKDTHTGTWSWVMEFEGGRKANSLTPISVTESYLITEIEQPNYGNEGNNFKFNCRPLPTMHYRKIRYCKWFDSKNHQILTGNSTKYHEIVGNKNCSLELKVSYRKDLDVWKCVAGLDGSSEEEIHATFDLSKISFNVTEDEPEEKLDQSLSNTVTISLIIEMSWNQIYIFIVILVIAIIIAYTVLMKYKYIRYGRIPTDEFDLPEEYKKHNKWLERNIEI